MKNNWISFDNELINLDYCESIRFCDNSCEIELVINKGDYGSNKRFSFHKDKNDYDELKNKIINKLNNNNLNEGKI